MPFLPLHDKNPRVLLEIPWVTWGTIALCGFVYLYQTSLGGEAEEKLVYGLGMIPVTLFGEARLSAEFFLLPPWLTLGSSIFLHAGLMHLLGNMLYLWVFGDNVEDAMGHGRFVVFYLTCGLLAGLAQAVADPASSIPTIGASGAVSGVLGAYLILHPKARVLIPIYFLPIYLPAYLLLIVWIGFQMLSAWVGGAAGGGVAWWAHIGGFAAGAALIVPFRYKTVPLFADNERPKGVRLTTRAERERSPRRRRGGEDPWR
ncbi:MAG: rhomboid family intramembrane serine protease [Kiloniellales bacterium]|nr:rhomboid family intramembrane serine protease [Kiloniellales bacterium]